MTREASSGFALSVLPLLLLFASVARADTPPSAWDFARDPDARARWVLHERVRRLLHPGQDEEAPIPIVRAEQTELRLEAARALLEEEHAADSPDVRLRFDLGAVYYRLGERQSRTDLYEAAVRVLAPAVETARDDSGLTEALETLAFAYAKLNRPREELAAWHRYIPRIVERMDPLQGGPYRIQPMMNMGEAEMRLGRVDDAIATFREVLRICGTMPNSPSVSETYVLDLWDLAVALDRSGDAQSAFQSMEQIIQGMGSNALHLIESDTVFFVPAWERDWYVALYKMARARSEHDPKLVHDYWANAEGVWDDYITQASADGKDPWLAIAKVRRERVHREAEAASKRVPKVREHHL
jgi:tetratricopeptide (TPR) repeat protein